MDKTIFTEPGHLIHRAARLFTRRGEGRFEALGLAIAQLPVLYSLKDGGALSQKALAELVQIEQPTMAQLLARMERDGLIRRKPDPADKRSSHVFLTPAALKKLPRARALLQLCNAEALQGFTEREKETLSHLLNRVILNLDPAAKGIEVKRDSDT